MSRILCVDDEPAILRLLEVVLKVDGHQVVAASTAQEAMTMLSREEVDAVLLDLGLPDRDGLELLGAMRRTSQAPVLVLSARTDVREKVTALDLGATDYVTKPFDGDELRARLRAALRGRSTSANVDLDPDVVEYGDVRLDIARYRVHVRGQLVALTPKEFAVLRVLAEAQGRVLTHASLLERIWGAAHRDDVEYLRVAVRSLRLKVELDPSQPLLIRNEPGIGYRLVHAADRGQERS